MSEPDMSLHSRVHLFVLLILTTAFAAYADPPSGYYDSVDTTSAVTLRATLHEVIDDHQRIPYTSSATDTWNVLESADQDPLDAGRVLDVYRNRSFPKYGAGNNDYNREHSWPKSYGFPDDGSTNYPYTDCHHLFICDDSYNSSRGNNPYADCPMGCLEKVTDAYYGQGGGSGAYPGNSSWREGAGSTGTWETWIGRRGDVARALFYLDVRYEGGTHGGTGVSEPDLILTDDRALIGASNTGSNRTVAHMGLRSVLYQWHLEDPVDDLERQRNDAIYLYQGNRNPYIDHPEWVEKIMATPIPATSFGSFKALYR
jgi:endonuclease I